LTLKKIVLSCALLCGALAAHAQEAPAKSFYPFVGGGLTFGGDQIGRTIQYESGNDSALHAGGLFDLRFGAEFVPAGSPMSFQLSLGFHADSSRAASNGSASFKRYPLELLTHYAFNDSWRVGVGARKALNAETSSSGNGAGYVLAEKYSSSVGFVLEGEYFVTRGLAIKVRGVSEKYKPETSPNTEVKGDHIGVLAVYYFK
jgi:hypothetical protein